MATRTWIGGTGGWSTPDDWSGGVEPGAGDNAVISSGDAEIDAETGGPVGTLTNSATLTLSSGYLLDKFLPGSLTVNGLLLNTGSLDLDTGEDGGGSSLTVGVLLINAGTIQLGDDDGSLYENNTEISANALQNFYDGTFGSIALYGGEPFDGGAEALLDVAGAAGFGATGVLSGNVSLSGLAKIDFASGEITTIATGSSLTLIGPDASVDGLSGLSQIDGELYLDSGAQVSTDGPLTNSGGLELDVIGGNQHGVFGDGHSSLPIGGALDNGALLEIGNASLSAASTVSAASLTNSVYSGDQTLYGSIYLFRSATALATLDIASAAGFGSPGELLGAVKLFGDSLLEFGSGQITSIGPSAYLELDGASAFIADAGSLSSNSALTGLNTISGGLELDNGAQLSTLGALVNAGDVYLDALDAPAYGGSGLSVGGALTNTGFIFIGNGMMTASTEISAAGLDNSGVIGLEGGATSRATLNISSAAGFGTAGVLTGSVSLSGDSLIEFADGQINSIAASGDLALNGASAFIADAASPTGNSALTGLTTNSGALDLESGAQVTSYGGLTNAGAIYLDRGSGDGGSSLTLVGTLTNDNLVGIGNTALTASTGIVAAGLDNSSSGFLQLQGAADHVASLALNSSAVNAGSVTIGADAVLSVAALGLGGAYTQTGARPMSRARWTAPSISTAAPS